MIAEIIMYSTFLSILYMTDYFTFSIIKRPEQYFHIYLYAGLIIIAIRVLLNIYDSVFFSKKVVSFSVL
jgi:hypothetical protein